MFGLTEFAILLTDTPHAAGATVVRRLQSLFSGKGLFVRLDLKVHEPRIMIRRGMMKVGITGMIFGKIASIT